MRIARFDAYFRLKTHYFVYYFDNGWHYFLLGDTFYPHFYQSLTVHEAVKHSFTETQKLGEGGYCLFPHKPFLNS
jgi:hypothetical protein